jgi:streptogramin lyase
MIAAPVSQAPASEPQGEGTSTSSAGSLSTTPLVISSLDELLGGQQASAAHKARHANPQAVAARRAARVSFQDLSPTQAAATAKAAFPALIERPAGGPPSLPAGQHIVRYPTNHAAQVSLPSGNTAVIESLQPIATKVHGRHLPLNLHLTQAGTHFKPSRSTVAVDVPKDLAEGVSLSSLEVSLTPVNANGSPLSASEGSLQGATVLWGASKEAKAGSQDLVTLAKAVPEGFELTSILLSERSPTALYFHVDMPQKAHLKSQYNGSIQVTKDGKGLATIEPVSAEDAEGTNVPVSMSVKGNTLILSVENSGDYLYPIAVDPEVNDSQLAKTTAGKRSNWEFFTSNASRFQGTAVYEGPGAEHLESKGIAEYAPAEWAYWGYQTKGVSHIYEIKTETSAHNKLAKIESFLEFQEPGGAKETKKMLSNEFENPEYEHKAATLCAANASKIEECLPGSGKAKNAIHFQQSATAAPGANYHFSDTMSQGIVSIAEPTGTHSTTSYNTTTPTFEFETEIEGKKEKVKRANALFGSSNWLSKFGGALELIAKDTGIGVSLTKLEYESSPGTWTQLAEHNYLGVENACQGVQCYETHSEFQTLPTGLPDGEQKLRYKAEEAISGTQSLSTEGQATVKVDATAPHALRINGLPDGNELSERPYELTGEATDGEGSTLPSSGIKSLALFVDGHEFGTAGGSCTVAKGACTATRKWTVNGAELGSGQHDIKLVVLDNASNEARLFEPVSIRHSTPVALGPGSIDLESGDFALGASDVSLGSGLTVGRNYSSRATTAGYSGPLGPEWSLGLGSTESLTELVNGSVLMTASDGSQTIFAALGEGKFESPVGDSNLEMSLEENKETKQKLAYYLKNVAAHTAVKFNQQTGSTSWLPSKQEGTTASHTVNYTYTSITSDTEYPIGGESAVTGEITTGPDGNIWFAHEHKVGKITPTGSVTEYNVGHEVWKIAAGPEGNLFAAYGGTVEKITTSGTVTEYNNPAGGGAEDIAVGPDGNLWMTNYFGAKIVKMTPGGVFSEYSLPAGSTPYGIVAGPDGNMWFTTYGKNKIGKISTSGTILAEYSVSGAPYGITAGSDGNLWFTERGGNAIGKITTSGTFTSYPLPSEEEPYYITSGPDGNLFYTTDSHVGRVTTSGSFTTFNIGAPALTHITSGPDRKLWFFKEHSVGTTTTTGSIAAPAEEIAPKPAGVSCSPEAPGCRFLTFSYAVTKSATGENESEWGEFPGRLKSVSLHAYSPTAKKMETVPVAQYTYDVIGRLRAEWDPRISPNLKKTYGYDEEGHVTALAEPGQEPWAFTYGTAAGDNGTGRLVKANRAPASAALWNGERVKNTLAPKITGTAREGGRLSVSNGSWSGSPSTYGYQWQRCVAGGVACKPIPGATNPNYTPQAGDIGYSLVAKVQATNGGGSAAATSTATAAAIGDYVLPVGSGPRMMTPSIVPGLMFFTDNKSSKIGRIVTSGPNAGTISEYALPAGSGPEGIAIGPDALVWFTEISTSKIGSMTSGGGSLTHYSLPAGSGPRAITPGPGGNYWFTEASSSKIGKITLGGTITEYALPTESGPNSIVSGPDGNLWFTENATNKIGKITTAGVITEYALPSGSHPKGIVSGPDGKLWFVNSGTSKIGKITTAGVITEYALSAGSAPEYITSAAEALWVTGKAKDKISKVTTAGAITEFALSVGSQPQGLAVNAAGELFYAESNDKIGRVFPASLVEGEAISTQPGMTLNYAVPITGTGAPRNMSSSEVAKWGQSDVPVEATAITAPDEPQSWPATSYKRASIYYLDEQGRQVNVAKPSSATYGSVSTTEYNEYNDVIRTLSPNNRATALAAGASSVEKSKLLDMQSTFNGEGAKEGEVAEPGTMLVESLGPQHQIKYRAGNEVKESLAREHKKYFYDQGAPGGETYHLLTEESDLAQLVNHEEVEVRTTTRSYSGQSNLGWKLRAPTSVTVDPEGLKLTTTTEYNPTTGQITEVRGAGADKTLSYTTKFGETGTAAGKLKNPWGTVVNSEGKLWVVDTANNRVEKFGPEGTYISTFGTLGSGTGQFKEPQGIALDAAGHIWVADTGNNRIQEFSSTATYMATVGSLGTESGKFKAPSDLAFDSKGNMWVTDTGNSRIEKFDKEAKYASEFSSLGSEPGKLKEPKGIAVDSGEHVWVADTGNNRIQEFSTTGSLLKRFGALGAGEGQLNTPIDLRIDSEGNIWTVDSLNNRAESFSPTGAYITQIGWKGTEAGQLTEPRGLAFDATGKVWITDSSNNRLEQWSKGPNAHDQKSIYYSAEANTEGFPACGSHPEWSGLVCETLPAKQPELMGLPKLPVTTYTYNMYNEAETTTETFGANTRTTIETYDAAGRRSTVEMTATTGTALPKMNFTYNKELGQLEKQTTSIEGKVLTSEYNRYGQAIKYTDSDGNIAKYKYSGVENDFQLEEVSDSSNGATSKQTYSYDATTKLRTKLIDSAAGSFTATYDAEGKPTSITYPFSICANYAYNSIGEATSVQYLKTSNCAESEPALWYSDTSASSVRGELLSQTSTLASESYVYDAAGHLTEAQETPAGEGCSVRSYAYDEEANRASLTSRAPGVGGACQTEGGTIESHNYDEANRLADGGMAYDGLGNVTKLPAADAEGHELTSTFYVDNAVASQSQNGVTNSYFVDPEGRTRETVTGTVKTVNHYDSPGETVAWSESPEKWTRNIAGIDGTLLATQTNGGTPILQLHDLQGNVAATIGDKAGETKLLSSYNSTEFGVPNAGKAPPKFAWLGAVGVESSLSSGVITYGATSYVPQTGRALQSEQIAPPGLPGGSGSGAAYTAQEEPWNMQGAARAGAEAPGLEAAREQAALEAALAAAGEGHDPSVLLGLADARIKGEQFQQIATAAEIINIIGSIPAGLLEKVEGIIFDKFSVDIALDWYHKAGQKLVQCSHLYKQGIRRCLFSYNEVSISIGPLNASFVNLGVIPGVEKCAGPLFRIPGQPFFWRCARLNQPLLVIQ